MSSRSRASEIDKCEWRRVFKAVAWSIVSVHLLAACSSKILKVEKSDEILKTDDFDKQIKIQQISDPATAASGTYVRFPGPRPVPGAFPASSASTRAGNTGRAVKNKRGRKTRRGKAAAGKVSVPPAMGEVAQVAAIPPNAVLSHQPEIEDAEGFTGRRPNIDPFRVGEKVTLEASYFGVVAGEMTLEVRPFADVNGRKSYTFAGTAISTSVFAMFYAVNDWFETYVDFENLIPYTYALHVKETKQLREARSFFDWQTLKASFLDKKVNADKQVEEKKQDWEIPAYSQNIFSIAYYIRTFQLKPGKNLSIRLAHENENLVVTAEVLRKERITTPLGELDTVVVKPKIELNGVFKPVGDIFLWFTDDDRKFIVKVESKIKIGTIVAGLKALNKGKD